MKHLIMDSSLENFLAHLTAPDGYVITEYGTTFHMDYGPDELWMLAHEWHGHTVVEISQTHGRKHRVKVMVKAS